MSSHVAQLQPPVNTGMSNIDTIPSDIPTFGTMFNTTGKNVHNIESMNENMIISTWLLYIYKSSHTFCQAWAEEEGSDAEWQK